MDLKKIVISDNDADDRELLLQAVRDMYPGIECREHHDSTLALQFLEKSAQCFDSIFLDLNLNGMDGVKPINRIRDIPRYRQVPIVVHATAAIMVEFKEQLPDIKPLILLKPYKYRSLVEDLQKLIQYFYRIPNRSATTVWRLPSNLARLLPPSKDSNVPFITYLYSVNL
ncbi:MAG: response regulator [Flavobacterium sp.]